MPTYEFLLREVPETLRAYHDHRGTGKSDTDMPCLQRHESHATVGGFMAQTKKKS
jgi:hypothetical protein